MAVLVEGISVIVRVDSMRSKFMGGARAFAEGTPNATLCADGEIARVGFMSPDDAQAFVQHLERCGLTFHRGGQPIDIVMVDQRTGPMQQCGWIGFGHTDWEGDPDRPIAIAHRIPSETTRVIVPNGWDWATSLSAEHRFVPDKNIASMKLVRREGNADIYLDPVTGDEFTVYRFGA